MAFRCALMGDDHGCTPLCVYPRRPAEGALVSPTSVHPYVFYQDTFGCHRDQTTRRCHAFTSTPDKTTLTMQRHNTHYSSSSVPPVPNRKQRTGAPQGHTLCRPPGNPRGAR